MDSRLPQVPPEKDAMRTTILARVARPAALVAALAALGGALACGDIASPSAPGSSGPTAGLAVPNSAAASGYALASGKSDSTTVKK